MSMAVFGQVNRPFTVSRTGSHVAAGPSTLPCAIRPRPIMQISRVSGPSSRVSIPGQGCGVGRRGSQSIRAQGLFDRIGRILRSYANRIVSSAEDPEKILDQTVEDMQNDLVKVRQAAAQVLAAQKQLEARAKNARKSADEWYKRAQLAVQKGEDDLAREALQRRERAADQASQLEAQLEGQSKAATQLRENARMLESKMAEAKSKKDTLKARAASARTSQQVSDAMSGLGTSTSTAFAAFDKMEQKVEELEASAVAAQELSLDGDPALEAEFRKLGATSVDDELKALKAQRAPRSLPRNATDAFDVEIENMKRKQRSS